MLLGADAVYMGVNKFNARDMAENFDIEGYIQAIEYAHARGIKVYLTLNTLLKTEEIEEALDLVISLYLRGLDAVITQDIGLALLLHKVLPKLPLHASTQMSVYSLNQVKFLESVGFKRVVLARELTLEEIEYICKNTDVEIEVFVHGALCVSVSGQCLLSHVIGNRSANSGKCAQPCRMKYSLFLNNGKEIVKNKYLLSKKDIYGLEYVNKLASIGVKSLKIEGRNKNPEYVYGVTCIYKKYLEKRENKVEEKDKFVLKQLFNRDGISDGYLSGVKYKNSVSLNSPKNTGVYLGKVLDKYKKFVKIKLEEDLALHDGIEIYSKENVVSNIVTCIKDEKGNIVNKPKEKGSIVYIGDFSGGINKGDRVYKTSSALLNKFLKEEYKKEMKKREFNVNLNILKDKNISVSVKELNISYDFCYIPQEAQNKMVKITDLENAFSKTQDTPFKFTLKGTNVEDGLFVPVSVLNNIRRDLVEKINENIKSLYNRENERAQVLKSKKDALNKLNLEIIRSKEDIEKSKNEEKKDKKENTLFVYRYNPNEDYIKKYYLEHNECPKVIYFDISFFVKYKEEILKKYNTENTKVYLYISNFTLENMNKIIEENIEEYVRSGVKGIMLGSFYHYEKCLKLKEKYGIKLVADYTFNISNKYSALVFKKLKFDKIALSVELSVEDALELSKYFNVEINYGVITVMTSRYCILGSFVGNKSEKNKCLRPCKENYYLQDTHNAKYYICCNDIDCVMKIVKYRKKDEYEKLDISKRYSTLD